MCTNCKFNNSQKKEEYLYSTESTDIFSNSKRSEVMSKVKSKNTKPELLLRSELHKAGYRYRLHRGDLPGKPDITLPKYRTVIFVNGCFWHQHTGCKKSKLPKQNYEFWKNKLECNVQRDYANKRSLETQGWNVIIVWECEIKNSLSQVISSITEQICNGEE